MRRKTRWSILLVAGFALAAAAVAVTIAAAPFRPSYATMDRRAELLATHAQYYAPAKSSFAPLVVLVSGCGGMVGIEGPNTIMNRYAEAAARAGAYAIIIDSFQPRGMNRDEAISLVCRGLRLRGAERAGDIVVAETLAKAHWSRDFPGVILAGWSHGSWAVMELLSAGPAAKKLGSLKISGYPKALKPAAVSLFYPYCGFLNDVGRGPRWAFEGPLLLVTAERDTIGPQSKCLPMIAHARGGLLGVQAVDYAGATHAFDEETQSPNSVYVYDPAIAAKAAELFQTFIASQVARLSAEAPA